MHRTHPRRIGAFTLIELLTVIAVIGILAAIIIPTVGKVRETTQRTVDANNLRELYKAAMLYAADNREALPDPAQANRAITGGTAYQQWFGQLAKYAAFNDPALLVSKSDGAVDANTLPPTVLDPTASTTLLAGFTALSSTSFNVVGGLRLSDPATTPVAFTRGLTAAGTWNGTAATADDVNIGVYKDGGGHVVFLGGNVQYFANLTDALVSNTGTRTANIRQAVPNRSTVRIFGVDTGNSVASPTGVAAVAGD